MENPQLNATLENIGAKYVLSNNPDVVVSVFTFTSNVYPSIGATIVMRWGGKLTNVINVRAFVWNLWKGLSYIWSREERSRDGVWS